MKKTHFTFITYIVLLAMLGCNSKKSGNQISETDTTPKFSIAIHGGAGALPKGSYTQEEEAAYIAKLTEALKLGNTMLVNGDSAVAIVESVIKILEDSPLFNAGKGAVFNFNGENKLDAAIMNGRTLDAGAVTNVGIIKNPICAARAIMEDSKYILISGNGAEAFAKSKGLEIVDPSYFYTDFQFNRWVKTKDSLGVDKHLIDSISSSQKHNKETIVEKKFGTVGCVVVDKYGNIAAGTSTGGLMNKMYDRIGDSPLIGSGTYANNNTCGISCTGTGEDFIKTVAANTVSNLMEFKNYTIQQAIDTVIKKRFIPINGDGGMIGVDKFGNVAFCFNSDGMFRGSIIQNGDVYVEIYDKK